MHLALVLSQGLCQPMSAQRESETGQWRSRRRALYGSYPEEANMATHLQPWLIMGECVMLCVIYIYFYMITVTRALKRSVRVARA